MESTLNQPVALLALAAAIYALVAAVKYLIAKKNGTSTTHFQERDRQKLNSLHESHSHVDRDGTPLWYVPRSMVEGQTALLEKLNEMVLMQNNAVNELKAMNKTFGDWECPVLRKDGRRREAG